MDKLWIIIAGIATIPIWYCFSYLVSCLIDARDSYLIDRGDKVWNGQNVIDPLPGPGEGYNVELEADMLLELGLDECVLEELCGNG